RRRTGPRTGAPPPHSPKPTLPTPPAPTRPPDGLRRRGAPMSQAPEKLPEGALISHLLELRDRLLRALVAVGIAFLPCVYYSNDLFTFVAQPLIAKLPEGSNLIATGCQRPSNFPHFRPSKFPQVAVLDDNYFFRVLVFT